MRNALIALLFTCSAAWAVEVDKIWVQPSEILVTAEGRAVLVTGATSAGHNIDLSADAEFTVQGDAVRLGDDGRLYPVFSDLISGVSHSVGPEQVHVDGTLLTVAFDLGDYSRPILYVDWDPRIGVGG